MSLKRKLLSFQRKSLSICLPNGQAREGPARGRGAQGSAKIVTVVAVGEKVVGAVRIVVTLGLVRDGGVSLRSTSDNLANKITKLFMNAARGRAEGPEEGVQDVADSCRAGVRSADESSDPVDMDVRKLMEGRPVMTNSSVLLVRRGGQARRQGERANAGVRSVSS